MEKKRRQGLICCKQAHQLHAYVVRCIWITVSQGAQSVAGVSGVICSRLPCMVNTDQKGRH